MHPSPKTISCLPSSTTDCGRLDLIRLVVATLEKDILWVALALHPPTLPILRQSLKGLFTLVTIINVLVVMSRYCCIISHTGSLPTQGNCGTIAKTKGEFANLQFLAGAPSSYPPEAEEKKKTTTLLLLSTALLPLSVCGGWLVGVVVERVGE